MQPFVAAVLVACAPPTLPVELEPRIEIVAPASDEVVPLEVSAEGTCDLVVLVAVDVDNVRIAEQAGAAGDHWHLVVQGREDDTLLMVTDSQSATYQVTDLAPDTRITLIATLQDADHRPIPGPFTEARSEIELVAPEGGCP